MQARHGWGSTSHIGVTCAGRVLWHGRSMEALGIRGRVILAWALVIFSTEVTRAACTGCTTFQAPVSWGMVSITNLGDASGIAPSWRNPGVLWTHNDGGRGLIFAIRTNGAHLATYDTTKRTDDNEDIAVGPGPVPGRSYLYLGDIGGDVDTNTVRNGVRVIRVEEPSVDLAWASNPFIGEFPVEPDTFTLMYPDGEYIAEAMMVDPITAHVFIVTKSDLVARVYWANLNNATNRQTLILKLVRGLDYADVGGGAISPDGTQIVLRRENSARLWQRCDNEFVPDAFSRPFTSIPVVGRPVEPNGEAIGFMPDGSGYVTISDSTNQPTIYFFRETCQRAAFIAVPPENQAVFAGETAQLRALAGGNPAPTYEWRYNGNILPGQSGPTLTIANVSSANVGQYQVRAFNALGSAAATATVSIRPRASIRITEAMPSPSDNPNFPTSDWWEVTNFGTEPVDLQGWRFNDASGGLDDAYTFTNSIIVQPGQSAVFVVDMEPFQFALWWWAALEAPVPVVAYSGSGLSLGAAGDSIRLWDNAATDVEDTVDRVDFGEATEGFSFGYNPDTEQFGEVSVPGVNGAFIAASASDIGSPGRIRVPPPSPVMTAKRNSDAIRIEFDVVAGCRYTLQVRDHVDAPWTTTSDTFQATTNGRGHFLRTLVGNHCFYRVKAE